MNYRPVYKKIFIKADNSGGLLEKKLENGETLFIKSSTPVYETRYSEVLGVSPDIDYIKAGDFVYHHQFATQPNFMIEEGVYAILPDMVYGTKDKMFGNNVFLKPVFKEREVVIGSAGNAQIVTEKEISLNQVDVLRGKYEGKRMYCADIVHHDMGGLGELWYRSIDTLLFADGELNPCEGITLIKRKEKDFIEVGSLVIRKKDYKLKSHLQYGEVYKSNEYKEGELCLFAPYKTLETHLGTFDVVREGGIALIYDKETNVRLK